VEDVVETENADVVTTSNDLVIEYTAPSHVRDFVATLALGRAEDVKFSPNHRRLAVASYSRNKIVVFDVSIAGRLSSRTIVLTDVVEYSSDHLRQPHGIQFIDDETIIVANRAGDATIFKLPAKSVSNYAELVPLGIIRSGEVVHSPGSVSIMRKDNDVYQALICNNDINKITTHMIDLRFGCTTTSNEVLLSKRLNWPDGISFNEEWIAVSNHKVHTVFLYRNTALLNGSSDPEGVLRGVHYPHGLRFTSDGRFILVADAASPYVHIYKKDKSGWAGVRSPLKSIRVVTEEDFLRGQESTQDGGPKGIDIDSSTSILVATCKVQPLAFFDVAGILERLARQQTTVYDDAQKAIQLKHELDLQDEIPQIQKGFKQDIARIKNSRSWRITAPLRWTGSFIRALRPTP
jgi:DNA-binding beta-propeller fold protein YncE